MKKILFVCTGNICRSPTAEGVFRHLVEQAGVANDYLIQSVGIHGYHVEERPDNRSIQTAEEHGISMKGIKARKLKEDDFDAFDYILAMDNTHLNFMTKIKPSNCNAHLSLFTDFSEKHKGRDVPDPYYSDDAGFQRTFNMIEVVSKDLLNHLEDR